jgi:effector-binding domain-containing protein
MNAVELRDLESVPVAVVRRRVDRSDLSRVVPECCGLVWNTLRAQQIKGGRNITIYWDAEIRLEAGVESNEPFAEAGDLVRSATPGGPVVHAIHFGPYGQLGKTHAAIQQWCKSHGHQLAGPSWEIYGHWLPEWNDSPAQIRTDVFYQVMTR